MSEPLLIAEFTRGTAKTRPQLTVCALKDGRRHGATSMAVTDKREARRIALEQGAKPWNF